MIELLIKGAMGVHVGFDDFLCNECFLNHSYYFFDISTDEFITLACCLICRDTGRNPIPLSEVY